MLNELEEILADFGINGGLGKIENFYLNNWARDGGRGILPDIEPRSGFPNELHIESSILLATSLFPPREDVSLERYWKNGLDLAMHISIDMATEACCRTHSIGMRK